MKKTAQASKAGTACISYAPVWMNIDDFISYHPSHPSRATIYRWIHQKKIKFHKAAGSSLVLFLKSDVDDFLMGKEVTNE